MSTLPAPDGTTALMLAVERNDADGARLLLDAGANPRATNRYGVTPLALAAANGNAALIQALAKAGADPKSANGEGETALMGAARARQRGGRQTAAGARRRPQCPGRLAGPDGPHVGGRQ